VNICEQCAVIHDEIYWRHPELYHRISLDIADGANWYGSGTGNDDDTLAMSFRADVRNCYVSNGFKLLCQDCRKPYEDAVARKERITAKNAKLEAAGQKRLPGW